MNEMKSTTALTEAVYYILLSLQEPGHGYGIMQDVSQMSKGRVNLAAGTLYGALTTLLERKWIQALPEETNSRKKEYCLTPTGINVIQQEMSRLEELLLNGQRRMGGMPNEKQ